jgi:hypothetical protein
MEARAFLIALLVPLAVYGRSPEVAREFQRLHPCPSTGKPKGRCPGYVKDHIKPLCAGGLDHPSNMQWQTVGDAKKKDRIEKAQCRRS